MKTLNGEGSLIDIYELKNKDGSVWLDINNTIFITRDGMVCGVNGRKLYIFHSDGKLKGTIEFYKGIVDIRFVQLEDGRVYITQQIPEENFQFMELDLELCKIGSSMAIDSDIDFYNISLCAGAGNTVYIANHQTNVYSVDMSNGKVTMLFSWINSGANVETLHTFFFSNKKFFAINSIWQDHERCAEMIMVQKGKSSESEKKILRLACPFVSNLKDEVILFNKENPNYQIEIIDYGEYEDPGLQFQMDITAGKLPDIMDVCMFSPNTYAKKGLFMDLYTLMEQDQEVKREDIIESVKKTAEIDGKLYYMGPTFLIRALTGSRNRFGNKESLSFSDMEELYKSMSKKEVFMYYISRQGFINKIVSRLLEQFVDWETGTVTFDSEDFVHIIEFSKQFPDQEDIDYDTQDLGKLVSQDRMLLWDASFMDINTAQFYQKIYQKAGGCVILGYPSAEGNNSLKMSFYSTELAISEQCSDKDGAWEFVRQFFTYEYQLKQTYHPLDWGDGGFSIRKDVLEKELEYALTTESYTGTDGTEVKPVDTYSNLGNFNVDLGPLNKDETDMIRNLIARIDGFDYYTSTDKNIKEIMNIVEEDVSAYYAGDKTAKEVAEIIQKRVSIYVSEHM